MVFCMDFGSSSGRCIWRHQRDVDGNRRVAGKRKRHELGIPAADTKFYSVFICYEHGDCKENWAVSADHGVTSR